MAWFMLVTFWLTGESPRWLKNIKTVILVIVHGFIAKISRCCPLDCQMSLEIQWSNYTAPNAWIFITLNHQDIIILTVLISALDFLICESQEIEFLNVLWAKRFLNALNLSCSKDFLFRCFNCSLLFQVIHGSSWIQTQTSNQSICSSIIWIQDSSASLSIATTSSC